MYPSVFLSGPKNPKGCAGILIRFMRAFLGILIGTTYAKFETMTILIVFSFYKPQATPDQKNARK